MDDGGGEGTLNLVSEAKAHKLEQQERGVQHRAVRHHRHRAVLRAHTDRVGARGASRTSNRLVHDGVDPSQRRGVLRRRRILQHHAQALHPVAPARGVRRGCQREGRRRGGRGRGGTHGGGGMSADVHGGEETSTDSPTFI